MRKLHDTLPPFGELVPGAGGRLGAIMRGELVGGIRLPDYALIVPDTKTANLGLMAWGKRGQNVQGAASRIDGLANTRAMAAAGCLPAKKIMALTIEGHSDWYIGSRGEMRACEINVPELFEDGYHWTSTEDVAAYAFAQNFRYGDSYWYGKGNEFRVRAFRRIQLYHFTP